jgi:hypothetical protein
MEVKSNAYKKKKRNKLKDMYREKKKQIVQQFNKQQENIQIHQASTNTQTTF